MGAGLDHAREGLGDRLVVQGEEDVARRRSGGADAIVHAATSWEGGARQREADDGAAVRAGGSQGDGAAEALDVADEEVLREGGAGLALGEERRELGLVRGVDEVEVGEPAVDVGVDHDLAHAAQAGMDRTLEGVDEQAPVGGHRGVVSVEDR